ncbi:Uncharacterized protein Adt_31946 [Abeliophyllum distichum]|uniref:Uncharacterized protein n=1 Tax=Abeliophyllum distichum TaxID=126358 RepID=A0ABD1RFM8_9LAMI
MVEDVFIKMDRFIFPVDFIILDIEENQNMPVILCRPLLATSRALIDTEKCELILRVLDDERAVFSMYTVPEQLVNLKECFIIDEVVRIGLENCKPDENIGELVAILEDEKEQFKIWRAKNTSCKVDNCKQFMTRGFVATEELEANMLMEPRSSVEGNKEKLQLKLMPLKGMQFCKI